MRIVLGHIDVYDDRTAAFAHQLGLAGVQLHAPSNLPDDAGHWTYEDLRALRERCDRDGLVLEGLENVPVTQFNEIQLGAPGRDRQIENYHRTIRNMARAGITMLGYNFTTTYVWRTDMHARGRGDARVTAFDLADVGAGNALADYKLTPTATVDPPIGAEQMWDNYQYFLDAVLPVADEVGMRLALHPDDPPVDAPLGGAARIFTSPDALKEAHKRAGGSPAWGLNLCLGTVSEMAGHASVDDVIDHFGPKGLIRYVHFRDVSGTVPAFAECFLGEGNLDVAAVMRRLDAAGFDGFIIDDHTPAMDDDLDTWGDTSSAAYCSRGRAHAIGYLHGTLNAIRSTAAARA